MYFYKVAGTLSIKKKYYIEIIYLSQLPFYMDNENIQLETERLILNSLSYKDIPKITAYLQNPKISENVINIPFPYSEKDAIFWINLGNQGRESKEVYNFAIRLKEDEKLNFIGAIGIRLDKKHNKAELGYWLGEPFWGKGFMSEATKRIIKFGFEILELNKINATHFLHNPASGKIMIKNKMIKEAEIKEHFKKGDIYLDIIQYRLTRKEYKNL
ncbi:acetyltransferase, ribosomal protein N-acetylase [Bernardetia litoralis DSM 6794]|uniref:Acetyltransferase, ribosomal protein N-acetylase n=2 Tax=Bernardetia litoralis TaxID=999 RepID=I4AMR7_BERLS|nr:acetyltransferase, ribosomal protein N-acetylase [Bernardetia litoralis DSM 6794]